MTYVPLIFFSLILNLNTLTCVRAEVSGGGGNIFYRFYEKKKTKKKSQVSTFKDYSLTFEEV